MFKCCKDCNTLLVVEDNWLESQYKQFCYICRNCNTIRSALLSTEQKNRKNVNSQRWAKAHPEKRKITYQKYHLKNQEKRNFQSKLWRKNNPEYKARWNFENRDKIKIQAIERFKVYYPAHKEEYFLRSQLRRSRKKNLPASFSLEDKNLLLLQYQNCCAYCKIKLTFNDNKKETNLHWEHVIPLSKGGSFTKENIVPACRSCNLSKNNLSVEEFMGKRNI